MAFKTFLLLGAACSLAASAPSNVDTSLTLLYQNNLNSTDDVNHISFLVLDKATQKEASTACAAFGETLLTKTLVQSSRADIVQSLSYNAYAGRASTIQFYYIEKGVVAVGGGGEIAFPALPFGLPKFPILCTQSSTQNQPGNSAASANNKINIESSGNTYVGYRNKKSFRFLGIPYANPPERFVYSTPYSPVGKILDATAYGAPCSGGTGSESCLFLNIQTPYLPKKGSKKDLRPVMFWIHGGGFTGGSGADNLSDGGNLASREDIVVVNINYRLHTLGFFAVPGSNVTGNYGIADQITALEVRCPPCSCKIKLTTRSGPLKTLHPLEEIPTR